MRQRIQLFLLVLLTAVLVPTAHDALAQTRANKTAASGTTVTQLITYTPTDLTLNAAVLPASNIVTSAIINTSGARVVTLAATCGQIYDVRINVYAEDGTTLLNTYIVITAVPASVYHEVFIGTEIDRSSTAGTVSANVRMPQRAIAIVLNNTTATPSTCTARAFLHYD